MVAADWPASARTLVSIEATPLCRALMLARGTKRAGRGVLEFLGYCRDNGIRTAMVANTLVGSVNRDLADRNGIGKFLAVQVHSDEVGVRKPDPEAILLATRALELTPDQACGRRGALHTRPSPRSNNPSTE